MEVIRSSKTSVTTRTTQRHIPEDDIHNEKYVFAKLVLELEHRFSFLCRLWDWQNKWNCQRGKWNAGYVSDVHRIGHQH
jgi:hypothetical protein